MINDDTKKLIDMGLVSLINALEVQNKEIYYSSTPDERLSIAVDEAFQSSTIL